MSEMIDQYLDELETSKEDIKQSLINKGVTPTGGLTSYAEAVDSIKSNLGTATVSITKNGTQTITAEEYGYDGMSKVDVTVKVASGGSDKPQIFNGFRFTGGDIAQVDFSQYDWSLVYDTSEFFRNCYHSTGDWSNFEENFNGEILPLKYMFGGTQTAQRAGVQSLPNLGNKTAGITSTAYMCSLNPSLSDVSTLSQWDTSKVTDASYMFGSDQDSQQYNPKFTSVDLTGFGSPDGYEAKNMFKGCRFLESVIGTTLTLVGSAASMFSYCDKLTAIPQLDTSNVSDMNGMFSNCTVLTTIPQLDTSNVTNMNSMFNYCTSLTSIPQLDTSNVTEMYTMFRSCSKLTTIPQMDTSNVTNMSYMFDLCSKLTSIPQLDTSNVTNMYGMFYECYGLTTIPQLDTSNVTDVGRMFYQCSNLIELPDFNCVNVKSFGTAATTSWLNGCTKLQKLGVVDCDSVTDIRYFFGGSVSNSLTDFGGCRNLGKSSSVSNTNSSYFMTMAPNLTYESVMNVINGLYDRATAGLSVLTLKLHSNHLAMLSADDIVIATNKGWTIV